MQLTLDCLQHSVQRKHTHKVLCIALQGQDESPELVLAQLVVQEAHGFLQLLLGHLHPPSGSGLCWLCLFRSQSRSLQQPCHLAPGKLTDLRQPAAVSL